ncbi:hypothetical protein PQX77_005522 [Marasmius sp. AFHP31]|nr:hypothetical protein PQX77_005522 [Marasmius sp. AFHP31]
MDNIVAIAYGLALRSVVFLTVGQNGIKTSSIIVGLWEGIVTLHFVQKARVERRRYRWDAYLAYGVRMFVDYMWTENVGRLLLVVLWTGMGMILADVAPGIWYETGMKRTWRKVRRELYLWKRTVRRWGRIRVIFPKFRVRLPKWRWGTKRRPTISSSTTTMPRRTPVVRFSPTSSLVSDTLDTMSIVSDSSATPTIMTTSADIPLGPIRRRAPTLTNSTGTSVSASTPPTSILITNAPKPVHLPGKPTRLPGHFARDSETETDRDTVMGAGNRYRPSQTPSTLRQSRAARASAATSASIASGSGSRSAFSSNMSESALTSTSSVIDNNPPAAAAGTGTSTGFKFSHIPPGEEPDTDDLYSSSSESQSTTTEMPDPSSVRDITEELEELEAKERELEHERQRIQKKKSRRLSKVGMSISVPPHDAPIEGPVKTPLPPADEVPDMDIPDSDSEGWEYVEQPQPTVLLKKEKAPSVHDDEPEAEEEEEAVPVKPHAPVRQKSKSKSKSHSRSASISKKPPSEVPDDNHSVAPSKAPTNRDRDDEETVVPPPYAAAAAEPSKVPTTHEEEEVEAAPEEEEEVRSQVPSKVHSRAPSKTHSRAHSRVPSTSKTKLDEETETAAPPPPEEDAQSAAPSKVQKKGPVEDEDEERGRDTTSRVSVNKPGSRAGSRAGTTVTAKGKEKDKAEEDTNSVVAPPSKVASRAASKVRSRAPTPKDEEPPAAAASVVASRAMSRAGGHSRAGSVSGVSRPGTPAPAYEEEEAAGGSGSASVVGDAPAVSASNVGSKAASRAGSKSRPSSRSRPPSSQSHVPPPQTQPAEPQIETITSTQLTAEPSEISIADEEEERRQIRIELGSEAPSFKAPSMVGSAWGGANVWEKRVGNPPLVKKEKEVEKEVEKEKEAEVEKVEKGEESKVGKDKESKVGKDAQSKVGKEGKEESKSKSKAGAGPSGSGPSSISSVKNPKDKEPEPSQEQAPPQTPTPTTNPRKPKKAYSTISDITPNDSISNVGVPDSESEDEVLDAKIQREREAEAFRRRQREEAEVEKEKRRRVRELQKGEMERERERSPGPTLKEQQAAREKEKEKEKEKEPPAPAPDALSSPEAPWPGGFKTEIEAPPAPPKPRPLTESVLNFDPLRGDPDEAEYAATEISDRESSIPPLTKEPSVTGSMAVRSMLGFGDRRDRKASGSDLINLQSTVGVGANNNNSGGGGGWGWPFGNGSKNTTVQNTTTSSGSSRVGSWIGGNANVGARNRSLGTGAANQPPPISERDEESEAALRSRSGVTGTGTGISQAQTQTQTPTQARGSQATQSRREGERGTPPPSFSTLYPDDFSVLGRRNAAANAAAAAANSSNRDSGEQDVTVVPGTTTPAQAQVASSRPGSRAQSRSQSRPGSQPQSRQGSQPPRSNPTSRPQSTAPPDPSPAEPSAEEEAEEEDQNQDPELEEPSPTMLLSILDSEPPIANAGRRLARATELRKQIAEKQRIIDETGRQREAALEDAKGGAKEGKAVAASKLSAMKEMVKERKVLERRYEGVLWGGPTKVSSKKPLTADLEFSTTDNDISASEKLDERIVALLAAGGKTMGVTLPKASGSNKKQKEVVSSIKKVVLGRLHDLKLDYTQDQSNPRMVKVILPPKPKTS